MMQRIFFFAGYELQSFKKEKGHKKMNITERQHKILELLSMDSSLSITSLSEELGVTKVTIRSDLNSMAETGLIVRTHGGGIPAFNPLILKRMRTNVEKKERIAKAAASLIQDGDRIMLLSGTTCSLLVKYLLGKRNIHIVTNSSQILQYARINPSLHVTLIGGEFRSESEAFVGNLALKSLKLFHVKMTFIGSDGFSIEHGVTADLMENALIAQEMSKRAEKVILMTDSDKYDRAGFAQIMPIKKLHTIVIDKKIPKDAVTKLKKLNINVELV